jgi:hypothetical protein
MFPAGEGLPFARHLQIITQIVVGGGLSRLANFARPRPELVCAGLRLWGFKDCNFHRHAHLLFSGKRTGGASRSSAAILTNRWDCVVVAKPDIGTFY